MKHRVTRYSLFALAALAAAMPLWTQAQNGPQHHWVVEPEPQWDVAAHRICDIHCDGSNVYVGVTYQMNIYSMDGDFVGSWGGATPPWGSQATVLRIDADEHYVYLVVMYRAGENKKIYVLTRSGEVVRSWGTQGTAEGELNNLQNLVVDDDYVYTLEYDRVQVFTKDGTYVRMWGSRGPGEDQFAGGVYSFAVDKRHVHVVDSTAEAIKTFTKEGIYVRSWWPQGATQISVIDCDGNSVYACVDWTGNGTYKLAVFNTLGNERVRLDVVAELITTWSVFGYAMDAFRPAGGGDNFRGPIRRIRRYYRTLGTLEPNDIPHATVTSMRQRRGTTILDIDYVAGDENDTNVTVYAAGFVVPSNAVPTLDHIVPAVTFVEGTATNVGPGIPVGETRRLSWDMGADGITNKLPQYGDMNVSMLVKDNRGLLDLHFLEIPAFDGNPALTINRVPVRQDDLLPIWFWLLAADDSEIRLSSNAVYGVGGSYDGELLALGSNTVARGTEFLFERSGVREATAGELQQAREATTPGTVTEWEPMREPPPEGYKVNELNFVTSPTNGWWVVPVP